MHNFVSTTFYIFYFRNPWNTQFPTATPLAIIVISNKNAFPI